MMSVIRSNFRCYSTTFVKNNLFNFSQLSSQGERQTKLGDFIDKYVRKGEMVYSNFANDIIQHWAIEQPTRKALWTFESNSNECQILTFDDVFTQISRLSSVLTGKEFNLKPGKTVLVILPQTSQERTLLQLACLQSGLIFCPYDPKELTTVGIPQRIQKLAIDCIITNDDYFEITRKYADIPFRPLKKGLVTKRSTSESLPVGWNHLMKLANDAESRCNTVTYVQPNAPAIRLLSKDNSIIEYSQEKFNRRLMLTAFWLNMNQSSSLIWLKNQNEIVSIAPWLFGSSIFHKETENLNSVLNTLEEYPIDTLCTSSNNYQMIENQKQQKTQTHLKQLFSTEPINPMIKSQWQSLTNLIIRDDYADRIEKSNTSPRRPVKYHLGPRSPVKPIPAEQLAERYTAGQGQLPNKITSVK